MQKQKICAFSKWGANKKSLPPQAPQRLLPPLLLLLLWVFCLEQSVSITSAAADLTTATDAAISITITSTETASVRIKQSQRGRWRRTPRRHRQGAKLMTGGQKLWNSDKVNRTEDNEASAGSEATVQVGAQNKNRRSGSRTELDHIWGAPLIFSLPPSLFLSISVFLAPLIVYRFISSGV